MILGDFIIKGGCTEEPVPSHSTSRTYGSIRLRNTDTVLDSEDVTNKIETIHRHNILKGTKNGKVK